LALNGGREVSFSADSQFGCIFVGANSLVVPNMLMDLLATAEHVFQSKATQNAQNQQYISRSCSETFHSFVNFFLTE
jgi:hypothetical protein